MKLVMCIPTLSSAGAQRAAALIESAERGARAPDEYFVVDNGGHFAMKHPKVVVHRPGSNIGVGPAWNEALRRYGDWVIFANDDITLTRESVACLVEAAHDGSSMVCTDGHAFSFFLLRAEHVRRVGFFDEGFAPAYYEDTDYLRRMRLAGVAGDSVNTGSGHREQSTSKDMGWNASALIAKQGLRYNAKWGGFPEHETHKHPWGIELEVCVPSCSPERLQRLIESLAWQSVRPSIVTIASNADIEIDNLGLKVRQVKFWSSEYAIGDGDVSLRRNVATWAATAPYIVYSDDDQVWPQTAMEWFARRLATGDHFVVGHHRFVAGIDDVWRSLRDQVPDFGVPREKPPNAFHLWESCWGGCIGANKMLVQYGVGGWDQGYSNAEDQQLARRICGQGDDGQIRVHEPPWAWHEKDAVHGAPWVEPHSNVCARGTHDMVTLPDGSAAKCSKCPVIRRQATTWPQIQMFDPAKVRTEVRWL